MLKDVYVLRSLNSKGNQAFNTSFYDLFLYINYWFTCNVTAWCRMVFTIVFSVRFVNDFFTF